MAYTVHQAKTNFSRLLKEAEAGKEVVVMRGKKPVARLVPVEEVKEAKQRIPGGFEGLVHAESTAFDPLTDEGLVELGFGFMVEGSQAKATKDEGPPLRERVG